MGEVSGDFLTGAMIGVIAAGALYVVGVFVRGKTRKRAETPTRNLREALLNDAAWEELIRVSREEAEAEASLGGCK